MTVDHSRIEESIATLEAQRGVLDDVVIDTAVAALRTQLATMAAPEPRTATVLFVDIVGSTNLSSRLDAEDAHTVMDRIAERFTSVIAVHAGRVVKYTGDGLLAVFGADAEAEHAGPSAVSAALALHGALADVRQSFLGTLPVEGMQARVGVHTGPVIVGGGVEAEANIRGQTVNVAARMEQNAPPGGVRISHDTFRLVRGRFECGEPEDIVVKGVDGLLRTYLVDREVSTAFGVVGRGIRGERTRFVGRATERAVLTTLTDRADPGVRPCLIVADPGVGKSRLLDEFRSGLTDRRVLTGRTRVDTRRDPYGLVRDLLQRSVAPAQLGRGLAALVGIADPDQATLTVHRGTAGDAAWELAEVLRSQAIPGPPVILLEDVHWADDESLDLLGEAAATGGGLDAVVVATARPEFLQRTSCRWLLDGTRIELHPLDGADAQSLVDALCERLPDVPVELRNFVIHSGDGVPFFMEEILATMLDDGMIAVDADGRWTLDAARLDAVRMPTTLAGLLQSRLESLGPAERRAAQLLSTIGYSFPAAALRELDESPGALDVLLARGLLVADEGPGSRPTLRFRHHLLHHYTYESALKTDRRHSHRRVAEWLMAATTATGARADDLATIAEHLLKAGERDSARHQLVDATRLAAAQHFQAAAHEYAGRARELVDPDDLALRWELTILREGAADWAGSPDSHLADLDELAELAELLDDDEHRADALVRRADAISIHGEYARAVELATEALAVAGRAGAEALTVRALIWRASARWRLGDLDGAQRDADEALRGSETLGDPALTARLLHTTSNYLADRGEVAESNRRARAALALFREQGDDLGAAGSLTNIGTRLAARGAIVEAAASFGEVLRIGRDLGIRDVESLGLINLGCVGVWSGSPLDAVEHGLAAARIAASTRNRDFEAAALTVVGWARIDLDDLDGARDALLQALELFELNGSEHYVCTAHGGLAIVALRSGDPAGARGHAGVVADTIGRGVQLFGIDFPFETMVAAYDALRAVGDVRAGGVLQVVADRIEREAAACETEADRQRYLDHAPGRRLARWRIAASVE